MNIKEKAKAYDEAINKIMDYRKGNTKMYSDVNKAIDYLFPELAESEDERIRKDIILAISDAFVKSERRDKWIAWLEKQDEPKEYTFKSLPRLFDMIEPTSKAKAYCQKLIDTLAKEGYTTDAKIIGGCLKTMNGENVPMAIMDEKQGEQKPAFEMKTPEESLGIDSETYNKIVDECIYGEQKPADIIPEEFEKYVEQLLSLSDGEGHGRPAKVKEVSLNLLKLAKIEQKSTWSEEDKHRMDILCQFLKMYGFNYYGQSALQGTISWIKSLKPQNHWKPSKKQIMALSDVLSLRDIKYDVLSELLECLKKLKE